MGTLEGLIMHIILADIHERQTEVIYDGVKGCDRVHMNIHKCVRWQFLSFLARVLGLGHPLAP